MIRPVDVLLEFLEAEKARGVSHVHLDDGAREVLRDIFNRAKTGGAAPAAVEPVTVSAAVPAVREPLPTITLNEEPKPVVVSKSLSIAGSTKAEQLASLRQQAENWGPAKSLGSLRETMVFATGNPDARVMLVGEAPGYQEEREREPFVGPAGQKLNDILKAMGISREQVYISNIVKFRPATPKQTTNNRKPTPEEMAACMPFVRAEIGIVKPECVIALGGTAAEGLLGLEGTVTSMRGPWHDFEGTPVRVTYHPSYLLQSGGSNNVKRQVWEDMLAVMEKIGLPISDKQRGYFLPKP
ncbi:MAG: uracil-DNA glycosylase [Luteolibacter sp.]|uniref:uracil-DNA glycosylase n=1 Tax=Luteolibacter sp. TaxID=1962973 RepID=UPI003264DA56